MAISTNSIIHYTKSLDNLFGILINGFSLKYCKEDFRSKHFRLQYAYPMICFCDIPLSEVKNHLDSYGHYGIGLKKEWAKKNGLNPVLYLERESNLSASILNQAKRLSDNKKALEKNPEQPKIDNIWREELRRLSSFIKNYESDLVRNGKKIKNYRFYDEREWRYVPLKSILRNNPDSILIHEYEENKEHFNSKISEITLEFDAPYDISYIIVKEDEDIHKILDFISQNFKRKLTSAEIELLNTKVISTHQIIHDF